MIIALGAVLLGFEWKSYEKIEFEMGIREDVELVEEIVIQTEQKVKPPAPKPPPQTTILNIVEDGVVKQHRILRYNRNEASKRREGYI